MSQRIGSLSWLCLLRPQAQAQVKQLKAEFPARIEYYIDVIRLDQLTESQRR